VKFAAAAGAVVVVVFDIFITKTIFKSIICTMKLEFVT
jgi:hypothetical protein